MKLKYDNNVLGFFTLIFYGYLVMSVFVLVMFGFCLEKASVEGESILSIAFVGLYTIITLGTLWGLVQMTRKGVKQIKGEEKKVGEKVPARIVGVNEGNGRRGHNRGRLEITYHNGQDYFEVGMIEKNDAFELLKLLLDPFPVQQNVYVPIDLFINKNKIYADLDSVDFSKVPGYEECKKIIEAKYQHS